MFRHSIALAVCLAAPSAFAGDPIQIVPDTSYRIIVDSDDRPEGPQTINGCELKPGGSCPGVDLSHQDLSGMSLDGIDLTGAKLTRVDLQGASLKGAVLSDADLRGANLSKSYLQGAVIRDADLTGANLEYSRMAGIDFSGSDLTAASLEAVWASKGRFVGTTLVAANLAEAKLYHADMANATLGDNLNRFTIWEGVHMENCTGCPFDW